MMNRLLHFFVCVLFVCMLLCMFFIVCKERSIRVPDAGCRVDTIRTVDTVRIADPKFKTESSIGRVCIRAPRAKGGGVGRQDSDLVECGSANMYFGVGAGGEPRCCEDSVEVVLPLSQRVYESDEYKAWVSGVRPQLDSIVVYRRCETVNIRYPPKRWHIGPTLGVGVSSKGIGSFIGVSLTYSVISF